MPKGKVNRKMLNYISNRLDGKSKRKSALEAGYSPSVARTPSIIENQQQFKTATEAFAKTLGVSLEKSSEGKTALEVLADSLTDNVIQDKDRSARNVAIKMAKESLGISSGADLLEDNPIIIKFIGDPKEYIVR